MDCPHFQEKFYDYLYDLIEGSEREELEQHIQQCKNCQTILCQKQKAIQFFTKWEPQDLPAGKIVALTTKSEIRDLPANKVAFQPRKNFSAKWASLAAAVLSMFFVFSHTDWSKNKKNTVETKPSISKTPEFFPNNAPKVPHSLEAKHFSKNEHSSTEMLEIQTKSKLRKADWLKNEQEQEDAVLLEKNIEGVDRECQKEEILSENQNKSLEQDLFENLEGNILEEKEVVDKEKMCAMAEKKMCAEAMPEEKMCEDTDKMHSQAPSIPLCMPESLEAQKPNTIFKAKTKSNFQSQFLSTQKFPIFHFELKESTSSYSQCQQQIENKKLPSKESVQIQEFINHFPYDYPEPKPGESFSIIAEIGTCPWNTQLSLLHLGIQAKSKDLPSGEIVADHVQGKLTFNPLYIQAYRLVSGNFQNEVSQETTNILAGQKFTMLYEIQLGNKPKKALCEEQSFAVKKQEEMLQCQLRYTNAKTHSVEIASASQSIQRYPSENFEFSSAVAGFALLLCQEEKTSNLNYDLVLELTQSAQGENKKEYQQAFLETVKKAHHLSLSQK